MDDAVLITLVQNYEELYDLKHSAYSNQQRRDTAWEEIGGILKHPGKLCRERWLRLRENYRKALSLRKTKSGQAAIKMKPPKFEKELSFLAPYLFDEENRFSNIASVPGQEENESADELGTVAEHECNREVSTIPPFSGTSTPPVINRRQKRKRSPEPSAASVLKDYIESRKNSNTLSISKSSNSNPLTNFFYTMAQTVEAFPVQDQIDIKRKLFQMVTDVEMRIANKENIQFPAQTHLSFQNYENYSNNVLHSQANDSSQNTDDNFRYITNL